MNRRCKELEAQADEAGVVKCNAFADLLARGFALGCFLLWVVAMLLLLAVAAPVVAVVNLVLWYAGLFRAQPHPRAAGQGFQSWGCE